MILVTLLVLTFTKGVYAEEGCGLSADCADRSSAPDLEARQVRDPRCDDDNPGDGEDAKADREPGKTGTAR